MLRLLIHNTESSRSWTKAQSLVLFSYISVVILIKDRLEYTISSNFDNCYLQIDLHFKACLNGILNNAYNIINNSMLSKRKPQHFSILAC